MTKLKVLDLFSGIGGFSLGLERTGGFETVAFCEIEEFPRKVLKKHWPEVHCYHDVRELTADVLRRDGIAVDVICGGFPCQDISVAGRREGITENSRSGLWSEIARLVGELRPQFVIVENVANLLSGPSDKPGAWFGRVLGDLAELGYDAEWENIPASALGAPHRRERVWLVAHPSEIRCDTGRPQQSLQGVGVARQAFLANTSGVRQSEPRPSWQSCDTEAGDAKKAIDAFSGCFGQIWGVEPDVGRVAHGVSQRMERLSALGNAVVPQIPEIIGRAILQARAA